MAQSRLTLNVNCQYVKDWTKTLAFLKRLDPVAVVAVIDDMASRNRIYEIKQALPNAKITGRCVIVVKDNGQEKQLDGSMHLQPQGAGDTRHYIVSPVSFIDAYGELGRNGLRLAYMNEPQATNASQENIARMVQHMIETIAYANETNTSLEVGGFGVGHPMILPSGQLDARFDDVLTLVSKHRDRHVLAIHLYAPVDTFKMIDAIIARCKALGIKPCRIVVSEFGFDTSGSGDPLNGYKSRGYTGEQFADWCTDKIKNLFQPYIAEGILEYVAVFGWGYDASFPHFDTETDLGWQGRIIEAKDAGKLTINAQATTPLTPNYTPVEFVAGKQYKVVAGALRNLRGQPSTGTTEIVGKVSGGDVVTALEQKIVGADYWWKITKTVTSPETGTTATITGWLSHDNQSVKFIREPEPVDDPPPVALPPAFLEVTAEYAMKMHVSTLKIVENVRKEAAGVLGSNVAIDAEIEALKAKKASNVLRAQDLETGAQMYKEIADNWKWIAEQTAPPVAA